MCIRDSAESAARPATAETPLSKAQSVVNINDATAEQLERCLLYTSDAADERSSVDLGGRRIINKKKNTKTQKNTTREHITTHNTSAIQIIIRTND